MHNISGTTIKETFQSVDGFVQNIYSTTGELLSFESITSDWHILKLSPGFGLAVTEQWDHTDGTHGTLVTQLNGSSSGTTYKADGTYVEFADDGLGAVASSYFTAAGVQRTSVFQSGTLASDVTDAILVGNASLYVIGNNNKLKITGNAGFSTLAAGTGDTTFVDGAAPTKMIGGVGNDTYFVNHPEDVITENANGGQNEIFTSISYFLPANVQKMTAIGTANLLLVGNGIKNTLVGNDGNTEFDAGSGATTMIGGHGSNTFWVTKASHTVVQIPNGKFNIVNSRASYVLPQNVQKLVLQDSASLTATGNAYNGILVGNNGASTLVGGTGTDVLQSGGTGIKTLRDLSGSGGLFGGDSADVISTGAGHYFVTGGKGNDAISLSSGKNVVAFNKGDGVDTITGINSTANVLSLGHGISSSGLTLTKNGSDLILNASTTDSIILKNWYASQPVHDVGTLQIIQTESVDYNPASTNAVYKNEVIEFNFAGLVSAFDSARAQNKKLTTWGLKDSLLSNLTKGSHSEAIGGDLSYFHGNGHAGLSGMDFATIVGTLQDANFGASNQLLHPWATISSGLIVI